jgi:hypothetical protein
LSTSSIAEEMSTGIQFETPLQDREAAILALSLGMSVDPQCDPDPAMQDLARAVLDLLGEDLPVQPHY